MSDILGGPLDSVLSLLAEITGDVDEMGGMVRGLADSEHPEMYLEAIRMARKTDAIRDKLVLAAGRMRDAVRPSVPVADDAGFAAIYTPPADDDGRIGPSDEDKYGDGKVDPMSPERQAKWLSSLTPDVITKVREQQHGTFPTASPTDGAHACADDDDIPPVGTDRLIFDLGVSRDSPVITGTWVTVKQVVSEIVDGRTWGDILRAHPEINEADIRACLAYQVEQERDDDAGDWEPFHGPTPVVDDVGGIAETVRSMRGTES